MFKKIYVTVIAQFDTTGKITPLSIVWEDGRIFDVDKILSINEHCVYSSGGYGTRYTVRILNKEKYLNFADGRWFVEVK